MAAAFLHAGRPPNLGLPANFIVGDPVVLGIGTFGAVFLARWRPFDKDPQTTPYEKVAVKIVSNLEQQRLESLEYLRRECVHQRKLNHPHVIGFREVGITTAKELYLALEYADSGNLQQRLKRAPGRRLAEAEARWFMQNLVCGMYYSHVNGVFNRDVKPANLLLCSGGYGPQRPLLKVADFGLSKSTEDSAPSSLVGSPNYMAPEVTLHQTEYDGVKADVFSCGVVLYEMVFGCLPFQRRLDGTELVYPRDLQEIVENIRHELWPQLIPPHFVVGAVPPDTQPLAPAAANNSGGGNGAAAPGPPPGIPQQPGGRGNGGGRGGNGAPQPPAVVSAELIDLLRGMLKPDPEQRFSMVEVRAHPWLQAASYPLLLQEPSVEAEGGPLGANYQTASMINAQFMLIKKHCEQLREDAMQRALDEEIDEEV